MFVQVTRFFRLRFLGVLGFTGMIITFERFILNDESKEICVTSITARLVGTQQDEGCI